MQRIWKYAVYMGIGIAIALWLYSFRGSHTVDDSENTLIVNTRYSFEDINSMDRSQLLSFRHSVLPENRLLAVYAEATPPELGNSEDTASMDWGRPEAIEAFRRGLEDTGVISRDAPISLFGPFRGKSVRAAILLNLANGHLDVGANSLKPLASRLVAIVQESDDPDEVHNAAILLGRMGVLAPKSASATLRSEMPPISDEDNRYWTWICIRENVELGSTGGALEKGLGNRDARADVLDAISTAVELGYGDALATKDMPPPTPIPPPSPSKTSP